MDCIRSTSLIVILLYAISSRASGTNQCQGFLSNAIRCGHIGTHALQNTRLVAKPMRMPWVPANKITGNRHMMCTYSGSGSDSTESFGRAIGNATASWQHTSTIPSLWGHLNDSISTVDFKPNSPTDIPAYTTTAPTSTEVPRTTGGQTTTVVTRGNTVVPKPTMEQRRPTSAPAEVLSTLSEPAMTTVTNTPKVTTKGTRSTTNARISTTETDNSGCKFSTITTDVLQFRFPAILTFPLHLDVSIKAKKTAKIILTQDQSEEQTLAFYEISLGTLFEQARGVVQHCDFAESCSQIEKANGFGLSETDFTRIWVEYDTSGRIQVGHYGQPAIIDVTDTDPIPNIEYVGFYNRIVATEWIFHDYC